MTRDQKATRRFLQRAALDVLQRSLSPRETRVYLGAPVRQVAARLLQGREAMEQWLEEELYFFLLLDNFRPRTEAIEQIPRRLQKGELTVRDAVGEIMLSTGFSLRNPGNDTFVTVILEQCLGLEVQKRRAKSILEAGKKMYDGHKVKFLGQKGQNQADIIKIVLAQEDFTRRMLDRQHRRLLGSPLAKKSEDIARVHADWRQFFPVLTDWMASDRYLSQLQQRKPKSDRQFIRALYTDLLERPPSYDELRNMRNAMQSMADPAPLRSVMAKVILDSGRARLPDHIPVRPFVQNCFLRYLGREPQQQELEEFIAVMGSANARPVHVVRALVGSPEYRSYQCPASEAMRSRTATAVAILGLALTAQSQGRAVLPAPAVRSAPDESAVPVERSAPFDLDVGVPPGSPTSWGRRFPAITPRGGPLFPLTGPGGGQDQPVTDPTRTVAQLPTVEMDVQISNSFGIVRILTWDLTAHLPWITGNPKPPPGPVTGRRGGEALLPEPGSALYWSSMASLLRLLLHPQLVPEDALLAHLVEVGEPVLSVLDSAASEKSLAERCRKLKEMIAVRRRGAGPLPGATPQETMWNRFCKEELIAVYPYDPEGGFGRRLFLFSERLQPVIEKYLRCDDPFLRRNAAAALGRYGNASSIAALADVASKTEDPVVLMRALATIGTHPLLRDTGPLVERLRRSDDPVETAALADAVGRLGSHTASPVLLALGKKSRRGNPDLLQGVLAALARIRHGPDCDDVARFAAQVAKAARGNPAAFWVKRMQGAPAADVPDTKATRGQVIEQLALLLQVRLPGGDETAARRLFDMLPDEFRKGGANRVRNLYLNHALGKIHPPVQMLFLETLRFLGAPGIAALKAVVEDPSVEPTLRGYALSQLPGGTRGDLAVGMLGKRGGTDEMKIYALQVLAADGHPRLEEIGSKLLEDCAKAVASEAAPELRYLWLSALRALEQRRLLKQEQLLPLLEHPSSPAAKARDFSRRIRELVDRLVEDVAAGMTRGQLRERIDAILDVVVEEEINPAITEATREQAREYIGRQVQGLRGHKGDRNYQMIVADAVMSYVMGFAAPRINRQRAEFKPVVLLEEEILLTLGRSRTEEAAAELVKFIERHPGKPLRAHACLGLGMIGRPELARHLVDALLDEEAFTRLCAAESLRHLTAQDFWADWLYGDVSERGAAAQEYFRWCAKRR